MATNEKEPFVAVFGGSPWEAELIKGLLEANDIKAILKDETLGSVTSPYAGLGGEMLVLVDRADYALAEKVIDERDDSDE